jgi:hypothetical protein
MGHELVVDCLVSATFLHFVFSSLVQLQANPSRSRSTVLKSTMRSRSEAAVLHKIRARQERREGVHGGHAESSESRARDVGNVPNNATVLSSDFRPILSSAAAQAASQAIETLARMEQTISPPQSGISDVAPLANEAIARAKQTVTRAAAQAPTLVATSTATKQHAQDTYPDPSLEGTKSVDRSVAVGGRVAVGVMQMGAIHRLRAGGPPSSGGAVGAVGGGGGGVGAAGAGAGSVGQVPFEMQGAQSSRTSVQKFAGCPQETGEMSNGKRKRGGSPNPCLEEVSASDSTESLMRGEFKKAECKKAVVGALCLLGSWGSPGAALTPASTAALGSAAAPEEAPAPAPAESMSRAEPAAAGARASFVLDSFQCPLTMEVMRDPVFTADGQTYERREIEEWFALGNRTRPLTGEELPSTNLLPNIALRKAIRENGLL